VVLLLTILGKPNLRNTLFCNSVCDMATNRSFGYCAMNVTRDYKTQRHQNPTGFICSHRFGVQQLTINAQCWTG